MREIRQSGSEGGGGREASPYPYIGYRRLRRLGCGYAALCILCP